jgi:hypothetical protein
MEEGGRRYVESIFLDERRRVFVLIAGPVGWGHWGHSCLFGERGVEEFFLSPGAAPADAVEFLKEELARRSSSQR